MRARARVCVCVYLINKKINTPLESHPKYLFSQSREIVGVRKERAMRKIEVEANMRALARYGRTCAGFRASSR